MIERLYVDNFRCLKNFVLRFVDTPSALLIGKNGAGKSTVLRALQVLQSIGRGPNRVGQTLSTLDFPFGYPEPEFPMRIEVGVRIAERRFEYAIALEWPPDFYEARVLEERLTCDGVEIYTRNLAQVQLLDGPAFGLDWHVFALPIINVKNAEREIRDFKNYFAEIMLLSPAPRAIGGYSERPSNELQMDGSNLAACVRSLLQQNPNAYADFARFVKAVIPDFSAIRNVDRGKEGASILLVDFFHAESHKSSSLIFDLLSDGEKCVLLAAYVVAASAAGSPVVCVWDEPDSHLSISEVGHFITALRRIANQGGQLIATSHHPEAIRRFSDENTIVLTRRSHLEHTEARPLADYTYRGDLIDALIHNEIIDERE